MSKIETYAFRHVCGHELVVINSGKNIFFFVFRLW